MSRDPIIKVNRPRWSLSLSSIIGHLKLSLLPQPYFRRNPAQYNITSGQPLSIAGEKMCVLHQFIWLDIKIKGVQTPGVDIILWHTYIYYM